jgi:hypothetical protein
VPFHRLTRAEFVEMIEAGVTLTVYRRVGKAIVEEPVE